MQTTTREGGEKDTDTTREKHWNSVRDEILYPAAVVQFVLGSTTIRSWSDPKKQSECTLWGNRPASSPILIDTVFPTIHGASDTPDGCIVESLFV